MSKQPKHHYIPVFYLKRWADANGRLLKFTRPYGDEIKHEPTSPKKTGYQRGLYRVPDVPEHLAEIIEQKFMKKMDDLASDVLREFIANVRHGWTLERREAWSRFIVGLMLRNPENLDRIKAELQRYTNENYDKWRKEYEATKKPGAPPFETTDALHTLKVTLMALERCINNKPLLDGISRLQWGMVDVTGTKYRLLTSDRPVVRTDGLNKPDSHLAVPLSPTRLFIATNNDHTSAMFQSMPPRDLVMRMNKRVVRNAIKFVWDTDLTNERLIKGQLSADSHTDLRFFGVNS
jgi:hypothetical protein